MRDGEAGHVPDTAPMPQTFSTVGFELLDSDPKVTAPTVAIEATASSIVELGETSLQLITTETSEQIAEPQAVTDAVEALDQVLLDMNREEQAEASFEPYAQQSSLESGIGFSAFNALTETATYPEHDTPRLEERAEQPKFTASQESFTQPLEDGAHRVASLAIDGEVVQAPDEYDATNTYEASISDESLTTDSTDVPAEEYTAASNEHETLLAEKSLVIPASDTTLESEITYAPLESGVEEDEVISETYSLPEAEPTIPTETKSIIEGTREIETVEEVDDDLEDTTILSPETEEIAFEPSTDETAKIDVIAEEIWGPAFDYEPTETAKEADSTEQDNTERIDGENDQPVADSEFIHESQAADSKSAADNDLDLLLAEQKKPNPIERAMLRIGLKKQPRVKKHVIHPNYIARELSPSDPNARSISTEEVFENRTTVADEQRQAEELAMQEFINSQAEAMFINDTVSDAFEATYSDTTTEIANQLDQSDATTYAIHDDEPQPSITRIEKNLQVRKPPTPWRLVQELVTNGDNVHALRELEDILSLFNQLSPELKQWKIYADLKIKNGEREMNDQELASLSELVAESLTKYRLAQYSDDA